MGEKHEKTSLSPSRAAEATRAELHLRTFPYFCISANSSDQWSMTYEEQFVLPDGTEASRSWTIRANPETGWPGEIEADVWRAIEHIIIERIRYEGPMQNPVSMQLSEIRRNMPGNGRSGSDLERIKKALDCLATTRIIADCFYKKAIEREDAINTAIIFKIAQITEKQRRVVNGRAVVRDILDHLELTIDNDILNNINLRYTRPLDKGYLDNLDRWISKRLYELLGSKFYGLRNVKQPYRVRYSRLCALLGNKRQQYLSLAQRILSRAHKELIEKKFLSRVEWFPSKADRKDWVLAYWPGVHAHDEAQKEFWQVPDVPYAIVIEGDFDLDAKPIDVEVEAGLTADLRLNTDQDAFAREVRNAFIAVTGTRRPFDNADQELLEQLFRDGVTVEDVAAGLRNCQTARESCSFKEVRTPDGPRTVRAKPAPAEPIKTLRYCEDHIRIAADARRDGKPVILEGPEGLREERAAEAVAAAAVTSRAAWDAARTQQPLELALEQGGFLARLRAELPQMSAEFLVKTFGELILVEATADLLRFAAPTAEYARRVGQYELPLGRAAGRAVELEAGELKKRLRSLGEIGKLPE